VFKSLQEQEIFKKKS